MNKIYTYAEMGAIFSIHPNAVKVGKDGKVYDAKGVEIRVDENVLPLEVARKAKIEMINASVRADIVGGFASDALGSTHAYKSTMEDQTNLMGAAMANVDMPFKCGKLVNGEIEYAFRPHTAAQLKQVFADGVQYKLAVLQKASNLKEGVRKATDIKMVESYVWA